MPKGGFILDKNIAVLLEKSVVNSSMRKECTVLNDLSKKTNILEEITLKFEFEIINSEFLINEDCIELTRQVQLATEKRIEKINQLSDDLLNKIEIYKQNSIQKYNQINESKYQAKELIKKVNYSIEQNQSNQNQVQIDQKVSNLLNKKTKNLLIEVEDRNE